MSDPLHIGRPKSTDASLPKARQAPDVNISLALFRRCFARYLRRLDGVSSIEWHSPIRTPLVSVVTTCSGWGLRDPTDLAGVVGLVNGCDPEHPHR